MARQKTVLLSLLALQAASNWSVTKQVYAAAIQGKQLRCSRFALVTILEDLLMP